ncbi:hypothetical protein HRR83_000768 [Exophiala dermatitidis]|nr:hypothetical protein HRR74_000772 [Exophiala dermatitidis]KAJ4528650.1 hypothetical protein HRR73_001273 [Exophiala dermatitidis]KAJ4530027.1 hypothetical protein HRR76_009269 [Exophiala dermatitidis]KAJ4558790.1 hypothetical protein HRR77_000770 [Exophiala dermatitidis]KAJ4590500.1 hypothetical protein HRR82_000854 [Exophiala dermatitidis]
MAALPFDLRSIDRQALFYNPDMAESALKSGRSTPNKASHLVALVHGLWGNASHLNYLVQALRERYSEEELIIHACRNNGSSLTYDGIEVGGERIAKEIEDILEELGRDGYKITKFSIVGYSLGGLVARYAIGLLDSKGHFDKMTPVNFTTFATPHLGVRTPLTGYQNHLWNVLGARTLSASGRQLFMIDKFRNTNRPILSILADPESIFIHALARFQHRSLYANIVNDRSAVFYTTGISRTDPFTDLSKIKIHYLQGYEPVILDPDHPCDLIPHHELPSVYQRFRHNSQTFLRRTPIILALVVLIPIATLAFLANSCIQTFRSRRRIQLHETDKQGAGFGMYRIPFMVREMRVGLEDAFENVNSAQEQEYLPQGSEEIASGIDSSSVSKLSNASTESLLTEKADTNASKKEATTLERSPDFPTLALTPMQFAMIKALDDVGIRKYPVHIHKSSHSHAAIIVRSPRPAFEEGKVVVRHWLENEFHI